MPLDGIVPADWRERGRRRARGGRVERIPYELCVLAALREALRRREIWVVGAVRWRNPDTDLPADFDVAPGQPLPAARAAAGPGRVHRPRCAAS